jgi:hypothetical protein
MKRQTAKRSDAAMHFFTPELYLQFNSADDFEADRADEAWERAIRDYRRRLDQFRNKLPASVKRMTELCLHDAEVQAWDKEINPTSNGKIEWSAVAVMTLQNGDEITTLIYSLWDHVIEATPLSTWRFSPAKVHWLYDEIDTAQNRAGAFVHRVLLSDGRVLMIPFREVVAKGFAVTPARTGSSRKTA